MKEKLLQYTVIKPTLIWNNDFIINLKSLSCEWNICAANSSWQMLKYCLSALQQTTSCWPQEAFFACYKYK